MSSEIPGVTNATVQRRRRVIDLALYALLCLIWGSTWLVIKVGYGGLGPLNVAALRFFIAGLAFVALLPALGARWPAGRTEWLVVIWVAVVLFGGDYGLIYWAEQSLDSGLTAILFATLPLITIAFAHVYVPADRITIRKLTGTLLAFFGVVGLFADHVRLDASHTMPMLAVIGAAVCAAAAAVVTKRHGTSMPSATLNAPAMLIAAVVLLAASRLSGEAIGIPRDAKTWMAILYLAIAGSVVTFLVYFSLLKTWTVTSLSFISVFIPVIALLLGFLFLDERPTVWTLVGGVLILAGVTLALTSTKSTSPPGGTKRPV